MLKSISKCKEEKLNLTTAKQAELAELRSRRDRLNQGTTLEDAEELPQSSENEVMAKPAAGNGSLISLNFASSQFTGAASKLQPQTGRPD